MQVKFLDIPWQKQKKRINQRMVKIDWDKVSGLILQGRKLLKKQMKCYGVWFYDTF